MEVLCNEAEQTALTFKKENPMWDSETIVYETMEIVELVWREELAIVEKHLRAFLKSQIFNEFKNLTNEND